MSLIEVELLIGFGCLAIFNLGVTILIVRHLFRRSRRV